MKDAWTKVWKDRLAAAKADPPRADALTPHVQAAVRRQGAALAGRGAVAKAAVATRQNHVAVSVTGRDAGALRQALIADLRRHRTEMREAMKAEAMRKLKGIGR